MPSTENGIDNDCDDEDVDKEMQSEKDASCIYCVTCFDRGELARRKSSCCSLIKVKDINYACTNKEKQERWFLNFKRSLKRHLTRLQHF